MVLSHDLNKPAGSAEPLTTLAFVLPVQGHPHVHNEDCINWSRVVDVITTRQAEVVRLHITMYNTSTMHALQALQHSVQEQEDSAVAVPALQCASFVAHWQHHVVAHSCSDKKY